ncbi:MAG TPA: hypothetical protein VGS41_06980 [Chthonomonadales bacterium]|nr:hypothetical protein [Chthonomonadales bacterium]
MKIPITISKDGVAYADGGPLPEFHAGADGYLVVPDYAVVDPYWRAALLTPRDMLLLSEGQPLLVGVRYGLVPRDLRYRLYRDRNGLLIEDPDSPEAPLSHHTAQRLGGDLDTVSPRYLAFVEAIITSDLGMHQVGAKSARLTGGACIVPCMPGTSSAQPCAAHSLNDAYTMISSAFEPGRRTHTGVSFTKVRFLDNGLWFRLEDLRRRFDRYPPRPSPGSQSDDAADPRMWDSERAQ